MQTATISPPLCGTKIRITNRPDLENVSRLDGAAMPMLCAMERTGMRVDRAYSVVLHSKLTGIMAAKEAEVYKLGGKKFSIGSGDQLADYLFKHLKLKQNGREKFTKSRKRLAADSDVLKAMVSSHSSIKPILDWKECEKLRSTYTHSLVTKADSDDRIHTDIGSTTAATGRLTSSNPNLQNIPTRTELGSEVRNIFIPSPGNELGTIDASQIEMRMNAHDSQCGNMMDVFWRDDDFYWDVAEGVYRREFSKAYREKGIVEDGPMVGQPYKKWFRQNAKIVALMTGYDASPGGLFDQFLSWGVPGWDEPKCATAILNYFKRYPEILQRKKVHAGRCYRYGLVWDMWGRVRWIPQVKSCHRWVVSEGLRQAGNLAGQGGAAGVIKLWMAVLWRSRIVQALVRDGLKFLIQVHDELVVEGKRRVVQAFLEFAQHTLRNLLTPYDYYSVPLDGNFAIAGRWGELK